MSDPIRAKLEKEAEAKANRGLYKRYSLSLSPDTYHFLGELADRLKADTGLSISRAKLVDALAREYATTLEASV